MKKIFYILGICAAALAVSCNKEDALHELDNADKGVRIQLVGNSHDVTKISIGEKDGDKYPLLWYTGDVVSVWSEGLLSTDLPSEDSEGNPVPGTEGKIFGAQAELYSESAGNARGVFQTINPIVVTAATPVVITYPGEIEYIDGVITGDVDAIQVQREANSSVHVGNNAVAYAKATLNTEAVDAVEFTLQQQTAFVKLAITTTDYSNYKLKGAKVIAPDCALSGEMQFNVEANTFTVDGAKDYVGALLRTPVAFTGTQNIYFTALPADMTGKKVVVSVEMTDEAGLNTVTVPVTVDGGKFQASCLTVIEVNASASAMSDCKWYEPVETRELVNGWAYGPQNTYLIEQKANEPNTITIDVKARGDFSRVVEPKYYGLYTGSSQRSEHKMFYINDPANYTYESGTFPVKEDYTIDVSVFSQADVPSTGKGRWTVVALYDADMNIIWSYMLWRYLEGDPVQSVTYPNGIALMDRVLGTSYSNKLALEKGTFDDPAAYFQWGRKDPTMWSNANNATHNPALDQRYNQRLVLETDDIATSIANPGMTLAYGSPNISKGDWKCDDHATNIWGYDSETGKAVKTIYDPCPAGYRVADKEVMEYVFKNAERWETANDHKYQEEQYIKADSPFAGKFSTLAVSLGGDSYDFWPYYGCRWGDKEKWGNRTSSCFRHAALYWDNAPSGSKQAEALQYCYYSSKFEAKLDGANKSRVFAVRCQVDTENR